MNIATQAGMTASTSFLRTRRTNGSGVTPTAGVVAAISGWWARTSRAGPQLRSSSAQRAAVGPAGPTIEEQRRPWRRARSAKARTASVPALTSTRLAPA